MPDADRILSAFDQLESAISKIECQSLAKEVMEELRDSEYLILKHGTRYTRNKGCVGPLCKKAQRDWQRQRLVSVHAMRGTKPRFRTRSAAVMITDLELAPVEAAYNVFFREINASPELSTRTAS